RWIKEMSPTISRLAFGAVLFQSAESHETGYELLKSYLPKLEVDSKGSFDFLYQINRPRLSMSGIPSLQINRLSKWAVVALQAHFFGAGKGVVKDMGVF